MPLMGTKPWLSWSPDSCWRQRGHSHKHVPQHKCAPYDNCGRWCSPFMAWVLKINLEWLSLTTSTSTHWAILLVPSLQILLPLCKPHNPVTPLARSLHWFSIYSKKNAKTSQTLWACLWPDHSSALTTPDERLYFQCFSFCSACPT